MLGRQDVGDRESLRLPSLLKSIESCSVSTPSSSSSFAAPPTSTDVAVPLTDFTADDFFIMKTGSECK